MRNNEMIRIAVADNSLIIRSGLATTLRRLPNIKIQPVEVASSEALNDFIKAQNIDMIMINPCFEGYFDIAKFKEDSNNKKIKLIAVITSFMDMSVYNKYDDIISIYDDINVIQDKICKIQEADTNTEESEEEQETLSQREKEVMICIVKGLTNKEIAEHLYISIHTVITHRRNISKKLEIHTVAGLTIYAIVNKLVSLDEIKIS